MTDTPETVVITAERLKQLEEAEMRLSSVEEKLKKRNHHNVENVRQYDIENPGRSSERSKKCKERNREAYNARRRELYKQRKLAVGTAILPDRVASDASDATT